MLRRLFPNVYEGWIIVAVAAIYGAITSATVHYGFGVIFPDLREEFGWGAGVTAGAFALRTEIDGLASPAVGVMVDRAGPRATLVVGVIVASVAVFLLSLIQNIWHLYAVMVLLSIGLTGSGGPASTVATATWFRRRRARAMALLTLGGGVAGVLVVGVGALVDAVGWRDALRLIAVLLLVTGMLPVFNTRFRPRDHHQPMDGIRDPLRPADAPPAHIDDDWGVPIRRAVRSRTFILLTIALAGGMFATNAFIVMQIAFLVDEAGASRAAAGSTVALFTLSSIIGRLGLGLLADRYDKRLMLTLTMVIVTVGVALLPLVHSLWQSYPIIVIIAIGFGGAIPIRPALVADYFGTKHFGTMNGLTTSVRTLGALVGPPAVGAMLDITGSYTMGWLLAAGAVAISVPLLLLTPPPQDLIDEFRPPAGHAPGGEAAAPSPAATR